MESNTSPLLSRQPSGIRALPSFDDDDDDDSDLYFSDNDYFPENYNNEITINNNNNNNGSSNDSGLTSFTNPVEQNPGNNVPVSGSLLSVSGLSGQVPVAKVSVEDDEDDIGGISEDENGEGAVVNGPVDVSTPRLGVVNGDGGFEEGGSKNESLPSGVEKIGSLASGIGEAGSIVGVEEGGGLREVESKDVEEEEVKLINEGGSVEMEEREDSVVEEICVDDVEVLRSGVVAVGDSGVSRDVKEEGVVGDNVKLGNEFEPLDGVNLDPVANHDVEFIKHDVPKVESMSAEKIEPESDVKSEKPLPDNEEGEGTHLVEEVEDDDGNHVPHEKIDVYGSLDTDGEFNDVLSTNATDASRFIDELERNFEPTEKVDSQIVTDTEDEDDYDEEGDEKEVFDSAALAALLKAATNAGSDSDTITIASPDGSRLFSIERPTGLGTSLRSLRPASRPSNSSLLTASSLSAPSEKTLSEEDKKKLQHMHQLRVKFLRLVRRLGRTPEDSVSAQVLYRLSLLGGRPTSSTFSLENAKQTAMELESRGKDDLDFSLTILVLGKAGVGKSATINSIFGEEKVKINAFETDVTSVNEVSGIVDGVKIRVIDAPGLKSCGTEQGLNRKVLSSVKKLTKKYPPDLMLYVDGLDSQTRDFNDLPLLKTITSSFGSSIWRSAIVTLTHAACTPPDGPSGSPLSYEVFVANRSHMVQQSIGQAVGDLRLMSPSSVNPVSLVENHSGCPKDQEGQAVLPSGQPWRPQLLLLCYSLKILSEANSLKTQDPFDHKKLFGFRVRSAPLPYLLSTMLQPRAHPKLGADQGGDDVDSDIDLDDLSDSDQEEEEDEYDQLPPFKPLRKAQIAKLTKDQKKAYFDEYDYRVKLLQRKQWREELKRIREMKKKGKSNNMAGYGEISDDFDAENEAPAAVPVPLPDMVLPPSFDSANPGYRYRLLEPTSQFIARPVLDSHGWDHDCGYDGVNMEQNLGIASRFPAQVTLQMTKDKKECNIHLDSSVSAKHGEDGSSLLGFDIQTIGKQPAYIIRGETKSKLLKKNKTGGGVSLTFIGENVATGVKIEDQFHLSKRLLLSGSTGTVRSQKDAAYGANLEVRLRDSEYPIGQDQSSLSLSLMKWRGDLAIGGHLQSQFSIGRSSKMAVRVSLNNKRSGQISVKTSSSDHLQLAMAGLVPIFLSIYGYFRPGVSENYSFY